MYKLYAVPADWDALKADLSTEYGPDEVVKLLKTGLDPKCSNVLVENYYNDKDYRSTYYNYYAKKGFRYSSACVRLHFFDDTVELLAGYELRFTKGENSSHYFGYMVLRPTRENTIGRSILSPSAVNGFHGFIIVGKHKVHLLGHRLSVTGFPYMSQHTDISVCAHAACWAILRHYSERFPRHTECLTYDITRMAQEFDPGGLVPSTGLHLGHAERIFAKAGTFPVLVNKASNDVGLFYRQLFAYVESGFPLFVEIRKTSHAIAIIGHADNTATPAAAPFTYASNYIDEYIVVDDNYLPYRLVNKTANGAPHAYGWEDFTAFIVPLPDKVYYSAEAIDDLSAMLTDGGEKEFGFDHSSLQEPVIKYFLTTAAHYREFMSTNRSQFDPELVAIVMQLKFPQFVWVVEIASKQQFKDGVVNTRAVIDATASPYELLPLFLMHDQNRSYFFDRGGEQEHFELELKTPGSAPLSQMTGDLTRH